MENRNFEQGDSRNNELREQQLLDFDLVSSNRPLRDNSKLPLSSKHLPDLVLYGKFDDLQPVTEPENSDCLVPISRPIVLDMDSVKTGQIRELSTPPTVFRLENVESARPNSYEAINPNAVVDIDTAEGVSITRTATDRYTVPAENLIFYKDGKPIAIRNQDVPDGKQLYLNWDNLPQGVSPSASNVTSYEVRDAIGTIGQSLNQVTNRILEQIPSVQTNLGGSSNLDSADEKPETHRRSEFVSSTAATITAENYPRTYRGQESFNDYALTKMSERDTALLGHVPNRFPDSYAAADGKGTIYRAQRADYETYHQLTEREKVGYLAAVPELREEFMALNRAERQNLVRENTKNGQLNPSDFREALIELSLAKELVVAGRTEGGLGSSSTGKQGTGADNPEHVSQHPDLRPVDRPDTLGQELLGSNRPTEDSGYSQPKPSSETLDSAGKESLGALSEKPVTASGSNVEEPVETATQKGGESAGASSEVVANGSASDFRDPDAPKIGGGAEGNVVRNGDGTVTKFGPAVDPNEVDVNMAMQKLGVNVPEIVRAGYDEENNYNIKMKEVPGVTLEKWLASASPEQIAAIKQKVVEQFDKMGNLYPGDAEAMGNFIVTPNGELFVIDTSQGGANRSENRRELEAVLDILEFERSKKLGQSDFTREILATGDSNYRPSPAVEAFDIAKSEVPKHFEQLTETQKAEAIQLTKLDLAEISAGTDAAGRPISAFDRINQDPDMTREQKEKIIEGLSYVRENFLSSGDPEGPLNWIHTVNEVVAGLDAPAAKAAAATGMTPGQFKLVAAVASIAADAEKTSKNFPTHHELGAPVARILSERLGLSPQETTAAERAAIYHQGYPPQFMGGIYSGMIRGAINRNLESGALTKEQAAILNKTLDDMVVNGKIDALANPDRRTLNIQDGINQIPLTEAQKQVLAQIGIERWAVVPDEPSKLPGFSKLSQAEQKQLVLDYYVATHVAYADTSANYPIPIAGEPGQSTPIGPDSAKFLELRRPGKSPFFVDKTLDEALQSVVSSGRDAASALPAELVQSEAIRARAEEFARVKTKVEGDMEQWLKSDEGQALMRRLNIDASNPVYWKAPLDQSDKSEQGVKNMEFAQAVSDKAAEMFRRAQTVTGNLPGTESGFKAVTGGVGKNAH